MNIAKELLIARMDNAKEHKCWRVVCARIRDIAKLEEAENGTPYERTLKEYSYDYYRTAVKTKF